MLKLKDSESFRKEYSLYKTAIDQIQIPLAKEKGLSLLSKLRTHCNLIDEGHSSHNNGNINPRALRDNITELVEIRKELTQLVKDSKIK
jgi:hypothetical protein